MHSWSRLTRSWIGGTSIYPFIPFSNLSFLRPFYCSPIWTTLIFYGLLTSYSILSFHPFVDSMAQSWIPPLVQNLVNLVAHREMTHSTASPLFSIFQPECLELIHKRAATIRSGYAQPLENQNALDVLKWNAQTTAPRIAKHGEILSAIQGLDDFEIF